MSRHQAECANKELEPIFIIRESPGSMRLKGAHMFLADPSPFDWEVRVELCLPRTFDEYQTFLRCGSYTFREMLELFKDTDLKGHVEASGTCVKLFFGDGAMHFTTLLKVFEHQSLADELGLTMFAQAIFFSGLLLTEVGCLNRHWCMRQHNNLYSIQVLYEAFCCYVDGPGILFEPDTDVTEWFREVGSKIEDDIPLALPTTNCRLIEMRIRKVCISFDPEHTILLNSKIVHQLADYVKFINMCVEEPSPELLYRELAFKGTWLGQYRNLKKQEHVYPMEEYSFMYEAFQYATITLIESRH